LILQHRFVEALRYLCASYSRTAGCEGAGLSEIMLIECREEVPVAVASSDVLGYGKVDVVVSTGQDAHREQEDPRSSRHLDTLDTATEDFDYDY
jgi:hypothetical protein